MTNLFTTAQIETAKNAEEAENAMWKDRDCCREEDLYDRDEDRDDDCDWDEEDDDYNDEKVCGIAKDLQRSLNVIDGGAIWTVVASNGNLRIYDPGGEYDCPSAMIDKVFVKITEITERGDEGFERSHEVLGELLGECHG